MEKALHQNTQDLTELLKEARKKATKERARYRREMSEADTKVNDLYHDIEYGRNINVFNSGKTVRSLQDSLKWRRRIKKKQARIDSLMSALDRNIIE